MTKFTKLLEAIFGKKTIKHITLDPESVKKHNEMRAMAISLAEKDGEIAKLKSELGKARISEEDKKEEEEVRWELDNQKKELQKKTYPRYFSLKTFFRKVNTNKKFREKLGFYSFDREKKLGNFGDIGFSSDGSVVLLNTKGEVIVKHDDLKKIFQSVGGLDVDVKNGIIPINFDSEGVHVPNMIIDEAYRVNPGFDGRLRFTKVSKAPIYKLMEEYRNTISDQEDKLEELELLNNELHKENNSLKVSTRVAEDASQTARAELSEVEKETSSIAKIYRHTATELAKVRDSNTILEESVQKLENQLEEMRKQAEREGVKLAFDDAIDKINSIRSILKQKTIIQPAKTELKEQIIGG